MRRLQQSARRVRNPGMPDPIRVIEPIFVWDDKSSEFDFIHEELAMTTFISKTLAALTLGVTILAASQSMAAMTANGWMNGWNNGWQNGWVNGWANGWTNSWSNGWANCQTVQANGHALRIIGIDLPR
jgi:hypothetical protein